MKSATALKGIGPEATSGADEAISFSEPYIVELQLQGSADILFHRWNVEAVAEKAAASKGSRAKKTDNVESYCYRNEAEELCVPGEYLRGAIINAAKFRQDPRSPRKSAADLYKAGVLSLTPLASLGISKWDYEHAARVMVQRNGVTRIRPAVRAGYKLRFDLLVNLPEYIPQDALHEVVVNAGRLIGLGDFRPTYGRFQIVGWNVRGA